MSSKSSLFLTNDGEHFYEECNDPHYEGEKFTGFTLILEMCKKNIDIAVNDDKDLIIEIKPGSELYKRILKIKDHQNTID